MKAQHVEMVSEKTGKKFLALLMLCPECGNSTFMVIRIKGQNHDHLQCVGCNTSFCEGGPDCEINE